MKVLVAFLVVCLAVAVRSQSCKQTTAITCTGDSYSCAEVTVTCNSYCMSGSTYAKVLGIGVTNWHKKCYTASDASRINCGTQNYTCKTDTAFGLTFSYCWRCCTGTDCNNGTPPSASSHAQPLKRCKVTTGTNTGSTYNCAESTEPCDSYCLSGSNYDIVNGSGVTTWTKKCYTSNDTSQIDCGTQNSTCKTDGFGHAYCRRCCNGTDCNDDTPPSALSYVQSLKTCQVTTGTCTGTTYNCLERTEWCDSYCLSGSDYDIVNGAGVTTWTKKCYSSADTFQIDCGTQNSACKTDSASRHTYCRKCCTGSDCKDATPPSAVSYLQSRKTCQVTTGTCTGSTYNCKERTELCDSYCLSGSNYVGVDGSGVTTWTKKCYTSNDTSQIDCGTQNSTCKTDGFGHAYCRRCCNGTDCNDDTPPSALSYVQSLKTCQVTTGTCTGTTYNCLERTEWCDSYCLSGSDYDIVNGAGVTTWTKKCYSSADTFQIDCGTQNSACKTDSASRHTYCRKCCTGSDCKDATPPSAVSYLQSRKTCQVTTGTCTGSTYNCKERTELCDSYCLSGSNYVGVDGAGTGERTWIKKCYTSADTAQINCGTQNSTCQTQETSNGTVGYCWKCCTGDDCNSGTPPIPPMESSKASTLQIVSPITIFLLIVHIFYFTK
ncbi:low-density lipoprotein receptor-related protein 1B-like [Sycon ciliatum]|uniref:low-density lipoprotein receptor-related protein 1B-like n=1 Tax=Sycon ciliatum TaxID=27933 RepID=UPI0031F60C7A